MTAYPPLPAPHPVRHKLFVNGRFVAACDCHMGTPLTKAGELPRRAHLTAVSQVDAYIVAYLQGRRRDALRALRACTENNADYWRWQGHAELSRQLLERIGAEVPK